MTDSHRRYMTRGRAFWLDVYIQLTATRLRSCRKPAFAGMTFLVLLLIAAPAFAADTSAPAKETTVPPHFDSLRSSDVNMRTGPGTRYPIEWVYKRKGLPVEVIDQFEVWRRVRDSDGTEGWVHKSELSGRRMALVTGTRNLLADGANDAPVVAHLEGGAMARISSCAGEWCKLDFDGVKGYLRKTEFWGAYANEVFN